MVKHIIMKKKAIEEALDVELLDDEDVVVGVEIAPEGGTVWVKAKEKCENGQAK